MYPLYGVIMSLNNSSVLMLRVDQDEDQALYEMLVERESQPCPLPLRELKAGPRIKGCKACITHLPEASR